MPINATPPSVTVFGGGGFVGRSVCEQLLKAGIRVRVAERFPRRAYFLQPLASVGQLAFVQCDISRRSGMDVAVAGASAVINLVGSFGGDLDAVHVQGARAIAEAAKRAGAAALVHVSAIGADPEAASTYARTKGEGEAAVRAAFPGATIIRPSVVFGAEDEFTNRFARMASLPFTPLLAAGTRFQPIWVADLARAIVAAAIGPAAFAGKTFEVGGPEVMTMRTLNEKIAAMAGARPNFVELPDLAGNLLSMAGFLPGAPITRDQWRMLQHDNVVTGKNGLAAFGIEPATLATVGPEWLTRYREGGRFAKAKAA
jgi:NADH dehydrogenase